MMLEAGEGWKGTDGAWVAFPDPSDGRESGREGGREDREQSWEAKFPPPDPSLKSIRVWMFYFP